MRFGFALLLVTSLLNNPVSAQTQPENGAAAPQTQPDAVTITPLKDATLDFEKLKNFGTRDYHTYVKFKKGCERSGASHQLAASVQPDTVTLREDRRIATVRLNSVRTCSKDSFLSLRTLDADLANGRHHTTVANGTVSQTFKGKVYSAPLPPETLSTAAFLRIVTLLPQDPAQAWSVKHFLCGIETFSVPTEPPEEGTPPTYVRDVIIRCGGLEKVDTVGKPLECAKFTVEWEGHPLLTTWVTPEGILRQYQQAPSKDTVWSLDK